MKIKIKRLRIEFYLFHASKTPEMENGIAILALGVAIFDFCVTFVIQWV